MTHTFVLHVWLDIGDTDPQDLMEQVEDALAEGGTNGIRLLAMDLGQPDRVGIGCMDAFPTRNAPSDSEGGTPTTGPEPTP